MEAFTGGMVFFNWYTATQNEAGIAPLLAGPAYFEPIAGRQRPAAANGRGRDGARLGSSGQS